ncbi:COesterase and/or Abhydrolase 3 domain containing protein, partial [Asbolus verrucosus]
MTTTFVIFLIVIIKANTLIAQAPVVQLPNGLIQGREGATIKSKTYYAFEKIPYATPPVGELRFKAPLPAQNWEGTLNTTYLDVSCHQLLPALAQELESEDCLYVNVFTPQLPSAEQNVSFPVMFFIHGGAFAGGSSAMHKSDLIVENDVVLVTINYRLGPFGFLSTQDEVIPGNNGLKDQQLAIQWTHDNIHLFGGDPEKVTIFGQSAGSASCAYQLLNQQSQGLFIGAILESGVSIMPSVYQRRAREIAFAAAAFINDTFTNSNDSAALLDFLLTVDAEDIKDAARQYSAAETGPEDEELSRGLYWGPVIEVKNPDAFITKKMFGLLQAGNVVAVPILIGVTSEEGLGLYPR